MGSGYRYGCCHIPRNLEPGTHTQAVRHRSAGWWLMDEAQHFSEGNFMSYQNGVKAFIAATQARLLVRCCRPPPV